MILIVLFSCVCTPCAFLVPSDSLGLVLQTALVCVEVLGMESWSSERAGSSSNHGTISPSPSQFIVAGSNLL